MNIFTKKKKKSLIFVHISTSIVKCSICDSVWKIFTHSICVENEFGGDSFSFMVESADCDGVIDDNLAEDSTTAFIEDRAQVSRPRSTS